MAIPILTLSVLMQFVAAGLAVRLIRISGRAAAWVIIASAITLMGIRRSVTLYRSIVGDGTVNPDVGAELIALLISFLLVVGVSLIGRIFKSLRTTEEQLQVSKTRYSSLVNESPDGIIGLDSAGLIDTFNPTAADITGLEFDAIVGRTFRELALLSPDDTTIVDQTIDLARTGSRGPSVEVLLNRATGGTTQVELTARQLHRGDGLGTQIVLRDIAKRKQLEMQLRRAERLEALGVLAGGVAHDFNNLLTVIMAGVGLAKMQPDEQTLGDIQLAAERAADLTQQLLAVGRRQRLQPQLVRLEQLVGELSGLLKPLLGEPVEIVAEIQTGEHTVFVDPNQLERVIVNLAVNAKSAMPNGGVFTVGIRRTNHPDHEAGSPPDWVELSVADDGIGMGPDVLSHIFEPFFTTKPQGEGTGLGLSTVLGFVEQSGGQVRVESTRGQGTTFRIYLPLHESDVVRSAARTDEAADLVKGRGCVLLVEDEELVRVTTHRCLEAAGYRVVAAANAEAALELFDEGVDSFDIVLTDMVMPRMGGAELAERLHQRDPHLPVVIMSGYTVDHEAIRGADVVFLSKPFTPQTLTTALDTAVKAHLTQPDSLVVPDC